MTTTLDSRPPLSSTALNDGLAAAPETLLGVQSIDWQRLRRMYVEGVSRSGPPGEDATTEWPSMRTLARPTGVSESWLRSRASRAGWAEARRAGQRTVERSRQEARAASAARHAAALDEAAVKAALDGLALVQRRLAALEGQDGHDSPADVIDARELESLATAAAALHAFGHKALGLVQAVKVEVDARVEHRPSVSELMRQDDPDRLYGFLIAAERSGLMGPGVVCGTQEA